MKITKLRGNNSQLPRDKEIGDIVVLASQDLFCWDGIMWQLIGARFLPKEVVDVFLSYVSSGFPDLDSLKWDLGYLLDTYDMLGKFEEFQLPANLVDDVAREKSARDMITKFIDKTVEVAKLCEKGRVANPDVE